MFRATVSLCNLPVYNRSSETSSKQSTGRYEQEPIQGHKQLNVPKQSDMEVEEFCYPSKKSLRVFVRGLIKALLLSPDHQAPPLSQYKTAELVQLVWSLSKLPGSDRVLPGRWLAAVMRSFTEGREGERRLDAANSQVGGTCMTS